MKQHKKKRLIFGVFFAILFVLGCEQSDNSNNGSETGGYNDGITIIPATTKVITKENEAIIISIDESILNLKDTDFAKSLKSGDVIVIGITSKTPEGALLKVKDTADIGNAWKISTANASFEDAFEQADMDLGFDLTPDMGTTAIPLVDGVSAIQAPLTLDIGIGTEFTVNFDDAVLFDADKNENTTNDQVVANGSVDIYIGVNFKAVIKSFKLKKLTFGPQVIEKGKFEITAGKMVSIGKDYKKAILAYSFQPVVFTVGIVPVVITPKLTIYAGLNGNLGVALTAGIEQDLTINAGVKYENNEWNIYNNSDINFDYTPPTIDAGAYVKAYTGPELMIKINGIVGPTVTINGYLEFDANVSNNPWWSLYGGVEGMAGMKIEVLSYLIAYWQTDDFISYKKLLAKADGPFGSGCTPDCKGKTCGNDGCEGECGTCGSGYKCENYKCVKKSCTPNCSGKECGDDGCGSDCGNCNNGYECKNNKCVETEIGKGGYCDSCANLSDSACQEGWVCNGWSDNNGNQLASWCDPFISCISDSQCGEYICSSDDNLCEPEISYECYTDGNVWAKDSCGNWLVMMQECTSGSTCKNGECVGGSGNGSYCDSCLSDSDCKEGWGCNNWADSDGNSIPNTSWCGPTDSCTSDSECGEYICYTDVNVCGPAQYTECYTDGNVWWKDSCDHWLNLAEECASNTVCQNGECVAIVTDNYCKNCTFDSGSVECGEGWICGCWLGCNMLDQCWCAPEGSCDDDSQCKGGYVCGGTCQPFTYWECDANENLWLKDSCGNGNICYSCKLSGGVCEVKSDGSGGNCVAN